MLALLSREKKHFNKRTHEYERRAPTMRELARVVGVHVSTLRRWKNQGVQPASRRVAGKLDKAARSAVAATRRELASDARRHKRAVHIERANLPVLPAGHRRTLKRYARRGRKVVDTGERYDSSWVNYAVHDWNFRELAALLTAVWKAKKPFQFVYEVPAGGQLPKSGDKPPRRVRKTTRAATAPVNPYAFSSEADLLDFLSRYIDFERSRLGRRMIYIAVDDNPPREMPGQEE